MANIPSELDTSVYFSMCRLRLAVATIGQCQLRYFHLSRMLGIHRGQCQHVTLDKQPEADRAPGFGVHISFVRSITMDKWSDDQFKKMKVSEP